MTEQDYDEVLYNQEKNWGLEQEYCASESAKAKADMEAQEEGEMVQSVIKMEAKYTVIKNENMMGLDIPCETCKDNPNWQLPTRECMECMALKHREYQAEISYKMGIKFVVEWVEAHSQVEHCDPDVMAYFNEYRWVNESEWQARLKRWEE